LRAKVKSGNILAMVSLLEQQKVRLQVLDSKGKTIETP
jgi:hypothetical protein